MTVSTETASVSYAGNGVTVSWAVPYYILESSHVRVTLRSAGGGESIKTLTTDYTVANAGTNPSTATVTAVSFIPATGETVIIERDVPATQETDLAENDSLPAETVERVFDKLTMLAQQTGDLAGRALHYPAGETLTSQLPVAASRANKFPVFDAFGNVTVSAGTGADTGLREDIASGAAGAVIEVATVAAMKALTGLVDGALVQTACYSVTGKGAGLYRATTTVGAEDGGAIINNNAANISFYLIHDGRITAHQYGAVGDGLTDDHAKIDALFTYCQANGVTAVIPNGDFLCNSSLVLPGSGLTITGFNRDTSNLKSGVIGDSLIKTDGNINFVTISEIGMDGNALTGASGNGHAINFIDPAIDSGTHTPQNCVVNRVRIEGFKGLDKENNGAGTLESCGIIQHDGLQNVYRDCNISNCGHGAYFRLTQNTKLDNCVVEGCTKYAVVVWDTEATTIERCDLLNSGDGVAATTYPQASMYSGLVAFGFNSGFKLINGNKLKNTAGTALVVGLTSDGDVISGNWLSASMTADVPHKAIYAERCLGIVVTENTFSPVTTAYSGTQDYEQVELFTGQTNEGYSATICDNMFEHVSGMDIAYNIKVGGNSSARKYAGVKITGNRFGQRAAASSACTVAADIVIDSCSLQDSEIRYNTIYAPTNVTHALGMSAATVTLSENMIGPNSFITNGGTITGEYSGITESVLNGSATFNPASLADGAGETTTVTVTGAALGDFAEASFSLTTSGITITAWVSAADTVSVRFQNESGGVLDIGSGTLRARVRKSQQ